MKKKKNLRQKVPQVHKVITELRFKPSVSGSRVHPLNHYADCSPQQKTLKI